MSDREINLELDDLCVLYPREKCAKLVEDIGHHFAVTVAAVLTPGRFEAVLGMHKLGAKVIAFYKNTAHKELITTNFLKYMFEASQQEDCPFFLSRAMIIEKKGLEPDPATAEPAKAENDDPKGESDNDEEAGESEEPDEEDEEEEEDEDEEGEGEELEGEEEGKVEPPAKKPKVNKKPAAKD
jgi:hypothetical protein